MATISVEKKHTLGSDEAIKKAKNVMRDFAAKLNAQLVETDDGATFKGPGFNGELKVTNDAVKIDVDLGLMLRPMKSTITSRIEKRLEENFA